MPLYMEIHRPDSGLSVDSVVAAHATGATRGSASAPRLLRYWYDEIRGAVFCLVEAPDAGAAVRVHGLLEGELYEVKEGM